MLFSLTVIFVSLLTISNTFALKNSTELICNSDNFTKNVTCKGDDPVKYCYYTSTQNTTLKYLQKHRAPVYNMSCDFDGICDQYNATGSRENTLIQIPGENNSTTHLYCCSTNNCNKPKQLISKLCYNAYKAENISEGTKEQCKDSESHCTKITAHLNGTEMQYFSCEQNLDITTPCKNVNSQQVKCFNTSMHGAKVEVCCCYGDLCLVPTFNFTYGHQTVDLNDTIWIDNNNNNKSPHTQTKTPTDWLFVGGLISAGVLILLIVIVAIIIAVKCRKKKESNRMMLAYTRLAADSTPDDDEDVRMLLG